MKSTFWKSTGAIVVGFLTGAVLSVIADVVLEKIGLLDLKHFKESSIFTLCCVILYRFVFNVTGCYITARIAPNNPMKHALIIGSIGTVLSILGTVVMWDLAIPFYNISIILISLPSAYLGAKLYLNQHGKN